MLSLRWCLNRHSALVVGIVDLETKCIQSHTATEIRKYCLISGLDEV